MAFFVNPSDFFIGGIVKPDLEYVTGILRAAKAAGYERVVEPCAGQMPIARVAAKLGFQRIEASDVTIFSGILGRYAQGRGIEDMWIVTKDNGELLTDPVEVLYLLKRQQLLEEAGNQYGENILIDYESREKEIKDKLKSQLDKLREELPSLVYSDMDMFVHIDDVMDDPRTVVICNAPGYKGGYEKYYKPLSDAVTWNEPDYQMFDAKDGYAELLEHVKDSKCLFVLVEDAEAGKSTARAVYARPAGRTGYNAYVVSNRPEEVERLAGLSIKRDKGQIEPGSYPIAPEAYEPKEIHVVPLNGRQVSYYRQILGHSNDAARGYGVVGDGYLFGVFGYSSVSKGEVKLAFASGNMDYVLAAASEKKTLRMEFSDLDMTRIDTFEGRPLNAV